MKTVSVYWSYRSPYSYLATSQLLALRAKHGIAIDFKVVYPIAVRMPEFFERVDPRWPGYLLMDTARIAKRLNLPYQWPSPDPIVQDASGIAKTQPYIGQLTRLGQLAAEQGAGIEFASAMSTTIFGGVKNWHEGAHIAEALTQAGLNAQECLAKETAESARLEAAIQHNQTEQAKHHWGVPLMVFNDQPFFGQDRILDLDWCISHDTDG